MKRHSSSKKKKMVFAEQKSGEQTQTPRVRKSYSVTNTNYLQLQLDTSSKKRDCLERTLNMKDKRIRELQMQVQEGSEVIIQSTTKCKQYRSKFEQEKLKNQRIQQQLKQAINLCRTMKEKCNQLYNRNEVLQKNQEVLKQQLKQEDKKYKDLREARKNQQCHYSTIIPVKCMLNLIKLKNYQKYCDLLFLSICLNYFQSQTFYLCVLSNHQIQLGRYFIVVYRRFCYIHFIFIDFYLRFIILQVINFIYFYLYCQIHLFSPSKYTFRTISLYSFLRRLRLSSTDCACNNNNFSSRLSIQFLYLILILFYFFSMIWSILIDYYNQKMNTIYQVDPQVSSKIQRYKMNQPITSCQQSMQKLIMTSKMNFPLNSIVYNNYLMGLIKKQTQLK